MADILLSTFTVGSIQSNIFIFTNISLRFVRRCAIENTCKSRCVKSQIQIEDSFVYRPGDKQLIEQLV